MAASGAVTTLIANVQDAASDRAACFGDGTANSNNVLFTLTTTSKSNAIPSEFHGRFVRLRVIGSTMYYFFSFASTTIATPGAATDAGLRAATQGEGPFVDGSEVEVRVPHPPSGGSVFFNRIGGTISQSCLMTLADGTVGLLGP